MAKRINFPELPVVEGQGGDTIAAYRDGQVVRIAVPNAGGGGTVTSVAVSVPTGFQVANTPVTSSGTIQITFAAGYGLPTTAAVGQGSTAYGWGNHALAGYASASAVASALAGKVDKATGYGLSEENFTLGEKGKLAAIAAGATANATNAQLRDRSTHTGTQAIGTVAGLDTALAGKTNNDDTRLTNSREWTASTVGQTEAEAGTATTRRAWTAQRVRQAITAWWAGTAEKLKLDGVQAGATANATDAALRARSSHTGTQPAATITGLATVATTGSYGDLSDKPSIPAAQVPADWSAVSGAALILNKPTLGTAAAANTSAFATAAQGAKADSALQPAAIGVSVQAYSAALADTTASYTIALNSKLSGIATGATANATDAALRARSSHTGTQSAGTITGLAPVATSGSYADLSGKPAIPAGTVTSVQVAAPTGLSVSGGPVTTSGTLTISYAAGYAIPTTAKQGQWDTAYGWGNHASAGYALASSLGTAAVKDAPASGNASAAQVVLGNDTRLTNARTPTAHAHAISDVTGLQGELDSAVKTSGNQTIAGVKTFSSAVWLDGGDVAYLRPVTAGGWARGFFWWSRPTDPVPSVRMAGMGALGSSTAITKLYVGFGTAPWSTSTVDFYPAYTDVKTSLRVDGSEVWRANNFDPATKVDVVAGYSLAPNTKQSLWDIAYGWGNHGAAGYATTSALTSGLAGKVGTGDARLSDARDWSASTVTQATAEAGTSTSRFAWTSQRVRQAIAAYSYSKSETDALISASASGANIWQATTMALVVNIPNKVDFNVMRTLTLPPSPAENDYVKIIRTAGNATGSTIVRNGQTIMGAAEDMDLDANISYLRLDFVNSSWRIAS